MRRLKMVIAGCVAAGLLIAPIAQAGMGPEYQGRAEKDKGTAFGFDVNKAGSGKKVANVSAVLPYSCEEDQPGGNAFSAYSGSMRVKSNGAFSGKLKARSFEARGVGSSKASMKIHGKLGKRGKAHGTLSADVVFTKGMRRGSGERCYTGILDWKVKRGARVSVPARDARWARG
ncbi:hypothetical protein BH10ACT11_BH10ACT11_17190 [soil metagenome]